MKKATILDVASRANVSIATVSRVFNNKQRSIPISDATARRVRLAAEELSYTPNALARSLVNRRTQTIGLVVPDILHNYFPEITRGVEGLAYERGYQVILCDSQEDIRKEEAQVQLLLEKQCDGVIIAPVSAESRKTADLLRRQEVPLVLIDRHFEGDFDYVGTDSYEGACIAVSHLLSLGHRMIGHIRESGLSSAEESLRGYRSALREAGIEPVEGLVTGGGYYERHGYEAMRKLIGLAHRPTAVFAANDPLAIGALQSALDSGLKVPEDMALIGSANLSVTGLLKVPLTTLDEYPQEIGKNAVSLLCDRLNGSDAPAKQIRIAPKLVIRESCGAVHTELEPPRR